LANKLLGLSEAYPPAKQLAIDMMLRLKMWPTIVELLLSENNVPFSFFYHILFFRKDFKLSHCFFEVSHYFVGVSLLLEHLLLLNKALFFLFCVEVLSALSLYLDEFHIWLNNNNNEMTFPISLFLETAQNLKDPILFYNVFRRIESEQVPDFELALQDFRPYYLSLVEPKEEQE
jgi:hypothetical protein